MPWFGGGRGREENVYTMACVTNIREDNGKIRGKSIHHFFSRLRAFGAKNGISLLPFRRGNFPPLQKETSHPWDLKS
jgi:hypothetical protein